MLIIETHSDNQSALTLNQILKYNIPAPADGFTSEINGNLVLRFDDEQDAINYAGKLGSYANTVDNQSEAYRIAIALIRAINDDGFVRTYTQE